MKEFLENRTAEILIIVILVALVWANFSLKREVAELKKNTVALNSSSSRPTPISKAKILADKLNNFPSVVKNLGEDNVLPFATKATQLVAKYESQGLTMPLLLGIIKVESGFNPNAISRAKNGVTPVAYGLMQVVRGTATPLLEKRNVKWTLESAISIPLNMEIGVEFIMLLHNNLVQFGVEDPKEITISLISYYRGERPVYESLDSRKKTNISLDYLGKVKLAAKEWEEHGF